MSNTLQLQVYLLFVRWFKHITDAAEAYKVKDGGRGRKSSGLSQIADGSSGATLDTSLSPVDTTSPVTPSYL